MEAKQQPFVLTGNPNEQSLSLTTGDKQTEFLIMVRQLQNELAEKTNECAMLRIRLDESCKKNELLANELNECKLTMFQTNEDSKKASEEVTKSNKLEQDYAELMNSFLDLEERYEQSKRHLFDKYLAQTSAINNYECLMSREALKHELEECKSELHKKQADLGLVLAKLRNMEEENSTREKSINELKKSLDDAKVTHKHEITILEEYIQCLKNTITSYEKTLATYLEKNIKDKEEADSNEDAVDILAPSNMLTGKVDDT